jgi:DNA-binding NtrC family response regulator
MRSWTVDACNQPRRVLVVEDEAAVRDLIVDVLIEDGFEVRAVGNARDALAHLQAGWPVDVLFSDLELKDGVDGARLAALVRKLRPDLPVVLTSGAVRSVDVPGCIFVAKPYEPAQVCALLARVTLRRERDSSAGEVRARNSSNQFIW